MMWPRHYNKKTNRIYMFPTLKAAVLRFFETRRKASEDWELLDEDGFQLDDNALEIFYNIYSKEEI